MPLFLITDTNPGAADWSDGSVRPYNPSGTPSVIYVGDWSEDGGGEGNDATGDGTLALPYLTIPRALLDIGLANGDTVTIMLAPGSFAWPNLTCENNWVTYQGFTSVAETRTITNVVAASDAAGIIVDVGGAAIVSDALRGRIVEYTSGAADGLYGVIYRNVNNTLYISQSDPTTIRVPINGDTLDLLNLETTLESGDNPPSIQTSTQLILNDLNLANSGTNRQWFFSATDNIQMERCIVGSEVANIQVTSGGAVWLRTCYLAPGNATAMAQCRDGGELRVQIGTVFDGVNNTAGGSLLADMSGQVRWLGETVFRNCQLPAFSGAQVSGQAAISNHDVWRFDTGTLSLRCNTTLDGAGGVYQLPHLYGVGPSAGTTANFAVDARNGARVRLGANSTIPTATVAKAVTTDGTNAKDAGPGGSYIENGTPGGWTALPLSGTWVAAGGQSVRYRAFPDGTIGLRGSVQGGGAEAIGTLPAGYRPPNDVNDVVQSVNGGVTVAAWLEVTTAGSVELNAFGATTLVSLDGIRFSTQS